MRLVEWNVGHRFHRRQMTPDLARALASLNPDIVVLTDYLDDGVHAPFHETLAAGGLTARMLSPFVERHRQVLIMAREPLTRGDIIGPAPALSAATRPNWLHVETAGGLNVVGFRVPLFRKPRLRPAYWQWLVNEALPVLVGHSTILLGDFNAAPHYRPVRNATSAGWQVATPTAGWSVKGKTGETQACDHALVSPHFRIRRAEYVDRVETVVLAGTPTAWSNHAALMVDVERRVE